MNEAQTRAELIDPALQKSGWGVISGAKILREVQITNGKIEISILKAKFSSHLFKK